LLELRETLETVVAERLPLTIQLGWMEAVGFLEKSQQKEKPAKRKVVKRKTKPRDRRTPPIK
jgi:hypothetical protein